MKKKVNSEKPGSKKTDALKIFGLALALESHQNEFQEKWSLAFFEIQQSRLKCLKN